MYNIRKYLEEKADRIIVQVFCVFIRSGMSEHFYCNYLTMDINFYSSIAAQKCLLYVLFYI